MDRPGSRTVGYTSQQAFSATRDRRDHLLAHYLDATQIPPMQPEAARIYLDALRALDVEARLRIAESLRTFAWELQTAVIAERNPSLSAAEVQQRVRKAFGHVAS